MTSCFQQIKNQKGMEFSSYAQVEHKTEMDFKTGGKDKLPEMEEESQLAFFFNVFFWSSTGTFSLSNLYNCLSQS